MTETPGRYKHGQSEQSTSAAYTGARHKARHPEATERQATVAERQALTIERQSLAIERLALMLERVLPRSE